MVPAAMMACVVAWLQLDGLTAVTRAWAVVLLVPLPLLMMVQARMLDDVVELPRTAAYVSSIASLWLLALATAGAAFAGGPGISRLGLQAVPLTTSLLLAAGMTAAGVGLLFAFKAAGFREAGILRQLLPVTIPERALFVGVAITAGICEELIFRGFLMTALTQSSGSPVLAAVISSGAFGVLHAYQRPPGALRAAIIGCVLASSVVMTGSIYAAIIAHIAIDLLSGLWLARYLLR